MLEVARKPTTCRSTRYGWFCSFGHAPLPDALQDDGIRVHYATLQRPDNTGNFADELKRWTGTLQPKRLIVIKPGDHRVETSITDAAATLNLPLDVTEDRHFLCSLDAFREHADGRKSLVMETFYRQMRREHDYLMDGDDPVGGEWNFDKDNRKSFGKDGPGEIPAPHAFEPDEITRAVIDLVEEHFPDSPGSLDSFDYPVTRDQALQALDDFIEHRLPQFGDYQDAMVTSAPYPVSSRLSCVLNLHLLDPREVIDAAVAAHENGDAPINAVEGFVRQILGWRVRARYLLAEDARLRRHERIRRRPAHARLHVDGRDRHAVHPGKCRAIGRDRLCPSSSASWCSASSPCCSACGPTMSIAGTSMYADAIDWVSLPNVLGMSQYGDGGIMGSKPYAASGNYINRMSDYCSACKYDPKAATGEDACPYTTLYWDFLDRNRDRISQNHRMGLQMKNLERKDAAEMDAIRDRAATLKAGFTAET